MDNFKIKKIFWILALGIASSCATIHTTPRSKAFRETSNRLSDEIKKAEKPCADYKREVDALLIADETRGMKNVEPLLNQVKTFPGAPKAAQEWVRLVLLAAPNEIEAEWFVPLFMGSNPMNCALLSHYEALKKLIGFAANKSAKPVQKQAIQAVTVQYLTQELNQEGGLVAQAIRLQLLDQLFQAKLFKSIPQRAERYAALKESAKKIRGDVILRHAENVKSNADIFLEDLLFEVRETNRLREEIRVYLVGLVNESTHEIKNR